MSTATSAVSAKCIDERDVRVEAARARRSPVGGRVHRAIIAAQQALREPALGDRHAAQREHGQHGAAAPRAARARTPPTARRRARGRSRRRRAATRPTPAASRARRSARRAPARCSRTRSRAPSARRARRGRARSAGRRASSRAALAARGPARGSAARTGRPRNHAVLRRSSSAVQRKTIAEPTTNGSPTMKIDERERDRQAGDPDAAGERAREQPEREVAGVAGGLRGDRADGAR